MRRPLVLLAAAVLVVLSGCDSGAGTTRARPGRAAAKQPQARPTPRPAAERTTAARPPDGDRPSRAAPRPEPEVPVWKVVSVHDGDTLRAVDPDKREHKVRLHGIDAPEIGQAFGTKARDRLAALVKGQAVEVHGLGTDQYGRDLARIEIAGDDVNLRLVAEGLAWHYARYSDDAALATAQSEARAARRGLWIDQEPMPPWDWRATERERESRSRRP